eukprot:Seg578.8 transcript_id=Seg578.8/GoldUCD/mRNA.D3Y31 product="hypothetical protein" protein_id=Seg578.8/GoldUCD/D3Y31
MIKRQGRLSKKKQAELLFDEFFDVAQKKRQPHKSVQEQAAPILVAKNRRSLEGDVVVSDAATKRYSGSFTRETHAIQSRTPPLTDKSDHHNQMLYDAIPPSERRPLAPSLSSDMMMSRGSNPEVDSVEAADLVGAVGGEEPQGEGPTEELIHETAVNIASMGDELNSEYKTRLENAGEQVIDSVNSEGANVSYEAFSQIFSRILPQDRDFGAFLFAMHLCSLLIWKLGFSFGTYLKRYLSEQFTEEAVAYIEKKKESPASS